MKITFCTGLMISLSIAFWTNANAWGSDISIVSPPSVARDLAKEVFAEYASPEDIAFEDLDHPQQAIVKFCRNAISGDVAILGLARTLMPEELELCYDIGARQLWEFKFGHEAVVLVSPQHSPLISEKFSVTPKDIWASLSEHGPQPTYWNEVSSALPQEVINVLGPPKYTNPRDAFDRLVMFPGCLEAGREWDQCDQYSTSGETIRRDDNVWSDVMVGEELLEELLTRSTASIAVTTYRHLVSSANSLRGLAVDGVLPNESNIQDGLYPASQPLYFYILSDENDPEKFERIDDFLRSKKCNGGCDDETASCAIRSVVVATDDGCCSNGTASCAQSIALDKLGF